MDAQEVKQRARGAWDRIFLSLAPALARAIEKAPRHVPCPVHGGKDGFRLFKDWRETGASICNTCGAHGDGFSTLMWVNGWSFRETLEEVATYLGERKISRTGRALATHAKGDSDEENERLRQALNKVWNESISISDRDAEPARLYLARRGISISPPETLRFHPSLSYYDGDKKIGEYPAIIAMVTGARGNPVTIHRTYLTPDGKKAPVESPKKLMAYPKDRKIVGGAIRLTEAGLQVMAVAEGLETSLAVMEGTGLPVWCAVNALLLENFVPPEPVERVLVFADKDRPTEQHPKGHGQEAAKQLVQRLWEMGIKASAIVPAGDIQTGQKSLDWLDILNRAGKAGFPTVQSIEAHLMRRAA